MNEKPPSAFALTRAMSELMAARQRLLDIDPDIEADAELYHDCLEGESGNAMQLLERVIEASIDADTMASLTKQRRADLAERQARFERRRDTLRAVALQALQALELRRFERPGFTASLRDGQQSVVVTDVKDLPDEFVRIERKPEKLLLLDALRAGREVRAAYLSNSPPILALRTR